MYIKKDEVFLITGQVDSLPIIIKAMKAIKGFDLEALTKEAFTAEKREDFPCQFQAQNTLIDMLVEGKIATRIKIEESFYAQNSVDQSLTHKTLNHD